MVNRRAAAKQARREEEQDRRRRAERRRSMILLGVTVGVVLALFGLAITTLLDDGEVHHPANPTVTAIGDTPAAARCTEVLTEPTDQDQTHVPPPDPVSYPQAPPAFGPHRPQPAPYDRRFYTAADRPEPAALVHNLEHGYVVLWYDEAVAADPTQVQQLRDIADAYRAERTRFIVAPWTAADGAAFPDDHHVALTRWTAAADDPTDAARHRGNRVYCATVSGATIAEFVATWPNAESPEPGLM